MERNIDFVVSIEPNGYVLIWRFKAVPEEQCAGYFTTLDKIVKHTNIIIQEI